MMVTALNELVSIKPAGTDRQLARDGFRVMDDRHAKIFRYAPAAPIRHDLHFSENGIVVRRMS
jgi:hypothetical protein